VLGEGAIEVDAEDPEPLTDVGTSTATRRTETAEHVALGGDEPAGPKIVDLRADARHRPGDLVAERHRQLRDPSFGPGIPAVEVKVGTADRRGLDLDQDLAGTRRRHRDLHQLGPGFRPDL